MTGRITQATDYLVGYEAFQFESLVKFLDVDFSLLQLIAEVEVGIDEGKK